jgi:protein phosphatase
VGIEHFLSAAPTVEDAVQELMNAALTNSGRDNVTLIVIDVMAVTVGHTESTDSPA